MKPIASLAVFAVLLAVSGYANGQQPVAVHTFVCQGPDGQGNCPKGATPTSIIQGSDGNFYGTAAYSTEAHGEAGGVVFSLTPSGKFTVLYTFTPGQGGNYPNGEDPGEMVEGPDGKLYGETGVGGANNVGTLFRLNRDGSGFQTIHSFCVDCSDGYNPLGMVAGTDGNVYGTTFYGGACGGGVIFQIGTAAATYSAVACIAGTPTRMAVGPDGTFYGTNSGSTLFNYNETTGELQTTELDLDAYTVLPVFGADGNLYGFYEDILEGVGLFEVQPDGANLQLFPYIPNFPIFEFDFSPLVLGSDGNLWIMRYDAPFGDGEILTISPTNGSVIPDPLTLLSDGFGRRMPDGSDLGEEWRVLGTDPVLWQGPATLVCSGGRLQADAVRPARPVVIPSEGAPFARANHA